MIASAVADVYAQANPDADGVQGLVERYGDETQVSAFDGAVTRLTEMDALVAYLQVLGQMTDAAYLGTSAPEQALGPEDQGPAASETTEAEDGLGS